jgi:acetylornithine deacetylase/succinyl-diaminopimelate desuccinylase-like protein
VSLWIIAKSFILPFGILSDNSTPLQTVIDYIAANEDRFTKELCEYIRIPSVSGQTSHVQDVNACANWLLHHCQTIGLKSKLYPTAGNPVVMATTRRSNLSSHHFVIYGHYDVQTIEPIELWKFPPFHPFVEKGSIWGRGASDNKGQHFAHLKAVEAFLRTNTPLPCDLTFLIEGEEEVGNRNLPAFIEHNRDKLNCDAVVISDSTIPSKNHPALAYALRGLVDVEVVIHGPSRDLHSGIFGGTVENPAMAISQILAQLRDERGRITIPGFYDDVQPLSDYERSQFRRIPFKEAQLKKQLQLQELFGEDGYSPMERTTARPTLEINGLTSGYQGEGTKTIIPAWAKAKITCRLAPNQKPKRVLAAIVRHLKSLTPPSVRLQISEGQGAEPYLISPTSPKARAALCALKQAFRCEPLLIRSGGSIPVVTDFRNILHAESLLLGLALPDDNAHSPNEKFDLDCFIKGIRMSAILWHELSST